MDNTNSLQMQFGALLYSFLCGYVYYQLPGFQSVLLVSQLCFAICSGGRHTKPIVLRHISIHSRSGGQASLETKGSKGGAVHIILQSRNRVRVMFRTPLYIRAGPLSLNACSFHTTRPC